MSLDNPSPQERARRSQAEDRRRAALAKEQRAAEAQKNSERRQKEALELDRKGHRLSIANFIVSNFIALLALLISIIALFVSVCK